MAESDPIDTRDVVQGSKTDVKDSAMETFILPTGNSSPQGDSQQQAPPEPLIQDALTGADGEEHETENSDRLEDVFQDEVVGAFVNMADFKTFARSRRGLVLNDIDIGNIVADNPHSIQEQKIQMLIKWREKKREAATALNIRSLVKKFNNPDSKKVSVISQRSNAYAQTVNKVASDTDVQTEILEQSTNQTQTEIKSYQENEFQTDKVETSDVNSQTNEQSLLDIHPAILHGLAVAPSDDKSALKMIKLYKNEKTKQDVGDLLPLLETTWKVKIILKSIEKQLGMEIQPKEQNLSAFISRVDEVYEIGIQYASENNFIHAVISFFAAANLHRIANKNNNSVNGISNCVDQVRLVVEKMAKQPGAKVIVIDHVIPLMHEMKDYVQFIKSSSRDFKVVWEAWCLSDIGNCYYYCDEYQQHANMNEYAIELLKKHFNNKAAKYCVYANCLNSAGVAYGNLGEIEKSIEKYKMSLKAYGEVNDWSSDKDKTDSIAITENNLKLAEAKLRK